MKSLSVFLIFLVSFSIAQAGVDTTTWRPIGSGKDNATYQHKTHKDQLLTIIETAMPEQLPLMTTTDFELFMSELKTHRKNLNARFGHQDWQISDYKLENVQKGQKVFLAGTFKQNGITKSFFETHYYEGLQFRNYQLVETKPNKSRSSESALKFLDEITGTRKPAEANREPNTVEDVCTVNSNKFLTVTSDSENETRTWSLKDLRKAYDDGDKCAKQLIRPAIEEVHDFWVQYGRENKCLTEDNIFEKGEGCSDSIFASVEQSLNLIDSVDEGLEAEAPDVTVAAEGACATGDCDQSAVNASSPVSPQQVSTLSDVSAAIKQSLPTNSDQCSKYAHVGHKDRFDAKSPSIPRQGWDCVLNILKTAANDISAPFVALWNWASNSIQNRTMVSGMVDALRALRDPVGLGSKLVANLVAHFTDHYEGFNCYSWPKRIQLMCQSSGQVLAFVVGGKVMGAGTRAVVKGATAPIRRARVSAPIVNSPQPGGLQKVNYVQRYKGDVKALDTLKADRVKTTTALKDLNESISARKQVSWFRRSRELNTEIRAQEKLRSLLKREQRAMERGYRSSQKKSRRGNLVLPATVLPAGSSAVKADDRREEIFRETGRRDTPAPVGPTKLPDDLGAVDRN